MPALQQVCLPVALRRLRPGCSSITTCLAALLVPKNTRLLLALASSGCCSVLRAWTCIHSAPITMLCCAMLPYAMQPCTCHAVLCCAGCSISHLDLHVVADRQDVGLCLGGQLTRGGQHQRLHPAQRGTVGRGGVQQGKACRRSGHCRHMGQARAGLAWGGLRPPLVCSERLV